jgi:hypothetical protein
MQDIQFCKHALTRSQQRSIPMDIIHYIYEHGRWDYTSRGVEIAYLDKKMRGRFLKSLGQKFPARRDKYARVYLIVAYGGEIVTVGYRTKKIWRR